MRLSGVPVQSCVMPDRQSPRDRRRCRTAGAGGSRGQWCERSESSGVYRFDRTRRASGLFVDTPPPTVSGSLHVGHVFSYTHTDIIARYSGFAGRRLLPDRVGRQRPAHRAPGPELLRRALRPSLPFDPASAAPDTPGKQPIQVSRPNSVALCEQSTAPTARVETLSKYLGLSVDSSMTLPPSTGGHSDRPARVSPLAGPGRRLSARGADALGHRLQDRRRPGRTGRSGGAWRLPYRALHPTWRRPGRHRDDPSRADSRLRGPRRASRR